VLRFRLMVKRGHRGYTGLKHQKEKRSMDHFAGLDVSVKETSVCIVDDTGKIVREVKVASEPEAGDQRAPAGEAWRPVQRVD
jgi:transposase